MQTIDIRYKHIDDAALLLIANAPAKADYFGFTIRAKYATTKPADVVAQYKRTIQSAAWSYGARLTPAMRARMKCDHCGATNCKMWREYQTFADESEILCGPCALKSQDKAGTIDARGYVHDEEIGSRCDQIGWRVPAVPVAGEDTFWRYASVPADGEEWWRNLPSYPR